MAKIKAPNPYDSILSTPVKTPVTPKPPVSPKPAPVPVPRQVETADVVRLNVILDRDVYRDLQRHAFDQHETVSSVMRRLIVAELAAPDVKTTQK